MHNFPYLNIILKALKLLKASQSHRNDSNVLRRCNPHEFQVRKSISSGQIAQHNGQKLIVCGSLKLTVLGFPCVFLWSSFVPFFVAASIPFLFPTKG